MAELKKLLEGAGFKEVKTLLASGNVIFDAPKATTDSLEKKIETILKKKYGRDIHVFVRTMDELQKMDKMQPFKGIKVTKNTRLYVSFCKEKQSSVVPKKFPGYSILSVKDREIFSVLELSDKVKTPDVMKLLGQKGATTMRNWNTVQKILSS